MMVRGRVIHSNLLLFGKRDREEEVTCERFAR